jgi:hypothetical protein
MIWDVRKYTDYRVNPPTDEAESRVKSLLYLHVDPAGKAGEGFRFPIFGNRIVTDIWGQDVFEDPDFHHVRYRLEVNAAQIEIRPNTFASKWEDWEEMVIRETLVPIKGPGINVVSTEVKKLLKEKMAKNPEFGASLRWTIQARGAGEIWLVLQGLPRPAGFLRRDQRFSTDYTAGMELYAVKLDIPCNPDRPCMGPIPVIFTRDEDKTKEELADKPETLHPGITTNLHLKQGKHENFALKFLAK